MLFKEYLVFQWQHPLRRVCVWNFLNGRFSIKIGQDKQNFDPRDCRNLLALEEESLIDSFKHEYLVLFNEHKGSIVLTFIVTNDKMEGNGRVLLHIRSVPSSDRSTADSIDSSRMGSSLSPNNTSLFPRSPVRFAHPPTSKPGLSSVPRFSLSPQNSLPSDRASQPPSKKPDPSSLSELSGLFASRPPVLQQGGFHYSTNSTNPTNPTNPTNLTNLTNLPENTAVFSPSIVFQRADPSTTEHNSFTESDDWSESTEWNFQRYSTAETDPLSATSLSPDPPNPQAKQLPRRRWNHLFADDETPGRLGSSVFEASLDEWKRGNGVRGRMKPPKERTVPPIEVCQSFGCHEVVPRLSQREKLVCQQCLFVYCENVAIPAVFKPSTSRKSGS